MLNQDQGNSQVLTRDDLQQQGYQAYQNGEDEESPYFHKSDEDDFWREGWRQAKQEDLDSE